MTKLEDLRVEHERTLKELRLERERADGLHATVQQLTAEVHRLHDDPEANERALSDLRAADAQNTAVSSENRRLRQENADLEDEIKINEKKAAEYDALAKKLKAKTAEAKESKGKAAKFEEAAGAAIQTAFAAKAEAERFGNESHALRGELGEVKARLERAEKNLADADEVNDKLRRENLDLLEARKRDAAARKKAK